MALLLSAFGDQRIEGQSLDERRYAHRVEALSRQEHEAHEIAERISEDQDLMVMPPFERPMAWLCVPIGPRPLRWALTMVASTMAYSMSGSF